MRKLLVLLGLLFVVLGSDWAWAGPSFAKVCGMTYSTKSGPFGTEGYIALTLNTGPDCSGATVPGSFILCSPGTTSALCSSSSGDYLNGAELAIFAPMLRAAVDSNQTISYSTRFCIGGGQPCLGSVGFRAD